MKMPESKTTDQDLKRVMNKLAKLDKNIRQPKKMFLKISVVLDKWVQENFERDGGLAHSGGWKPLKPVKFRGSMHSGARVKSSKGKKKGRKSRLVVNARILRDTGKGRASIKTKHWGRGAQVSTTEKTYMAAHHEGDGNLPVRRVIPRHRDVRKQVVIAAEAHLRQAVRRSFGP